MWVDLHRSSEQDRALLMERHLISRNIAQADHPRGVAIADAESLSIMVNEEDHLRMQVLMPGLQLEEVYRRLDTVDDALERRLDYAFSERWGYLTACPTNVGTGLRLSVMLHLPGLKLTKEIEKVRRSAKDLNLAVRGYYGEGSESAGDFYQISNQITLGRDEGELLEDFQASVLPQIIDYERIARQMLLDDSRRRLCDRVYRAIAVLRNARLIGIEEAMRHLSKVRLGIHVGLLEDVSIHSVNRLFLLAQDAHLRLHHDDPDLEGEDLLAARAEVIRAALT
jgi:protein arginine kinase